MISAWRSLILLRSATRLYSICSNCVRGITCFSCTCAHKKKAPKERWDRFCLGLSCGHIVFIVTYLPSFCSPGDKGSKSLANLPLSVCVKVLTIHQNTHLKGHNHCIHEVYLKIKHTEPRPPPTSILEVKARLTFAMMLTTFPTLE